MNLPAQIEALLFYHAEPVALTVLAAQLAVSREELEVGLTELSTLLSERGICVVRTEDAATLATAGELAELIERVTREEQSAELGRATLETLAVVLYQGPISKTEVDYIRGVNTQYALRALLMRGLIERRSDPHDARIVRYTASPECLAYLGVTHVEEIPEYVQLRAEIEALRTQPKEHHGGEQH